MHDPHHQDEHGRLDLVPLIDCVMILLLFFILTTRFTSEEQTLATLLPTDRGALTPEKKPTPVVPPERIAIAAYPDGFARGGQPSDYQRRYEQTRGRSSSAEAFPTVVVRVGNRDPLRIDGRRLDGSDPAAVDAAVGEIHRHLRQELAVREVAGAARRDQPPIDLHCFSGLPWKYAAVLYDAVRAYEQGMGGQGSGGQGRAAGDAAAAAIPSARSISRPDLSEGRDIAFAPPRVRDHSAREMGEELFEIIHQR